MPRAAPAASQAPTAGSTLRRPPTGPSWVRIFVIGLALWLATVLVTFATRNSNLIPTLVLVGSFLIPVTFVACAFGRAGKVITAQRIFSAFVYGGLLAPGHQRAQNQSRLLGTGGIPMIIMPIGRWSLAVPGHVISG